MPAERLSARVAAFHHGLTVARADGPGSASQPVGGSDGSGSASQPAGVDGSGVLASGGASEPIRLPKAVRAIGQSRNMSKAVKASGLHIRMRIHKKVSNTQALAQPPPSPAAPSPCMTALAVPLSLSSRMARRRAMSMPKGSLQRAPWCCGLLVMQNGAGVEIACV